MHNDLWNRMLGTTVVACTVDGGYFTLLIGKGL